MDLYFFNVGKMYLFVAVLVALFPIGACQKCPSPSGSRCNPIWKKPPPASCITQVENGKSLTWFDMQKNCAKDKGRLVWLRDDFTTSNLVATETSLTGANLTAINFIVIGLLHSMIRDDLNFWRNPDDNSTMSCGTEDTDLCLQSSATEKQCNMIGCCWLNGKCQYPEHQRLPEKNGSDVINTTLISGIAGRSCIGLQKSGKKWVFNGYNCSTTHVAHTGYVCEYKCQPDWPVNPLMNVSWPRNTSIGTNSTTPNPPPNNSNPSSNTSIGTNSTTLNPPPNNSNPSSHTSIGTSSTTANPPPNNRNPSSNTSIGTNSTTQSRTTSNEGNGASHTIYSKIAVTVTLILVIMEVQQWA